MAEPLNMVITNEGLAALVDAQNGNTNAITVAEVGLSATDFIVAPTLSALPGEFKRLSTISGQAAAANLIHLTASDTSQDIYDVRGVGIFLDDGTLFAVYGQSDTIFTKVSIATFLMSLDVSFADAVADAIEFGDSTFLYPPATETTQGVAELATQDETDAGEDDARIVTPLKLQGRLSPIEQAIADEVQARIDALAAEAIARGEAIDAEALARQAAIATIRGYTITGGGLITGGGALTQSRVLTVAKAAVADLLDATDDTKALTAKAFGDLPRQLGSVAYEVLPGGMLVQRGQYRGGITGQQRINLTFPVAFANTQFDLQLTAVVPGQDNYDNYPQELNGTRSTTGVSVWIQDPSEGALDNLSGFNWRAEGRY